MWITSTAHPSKPQWQSEKGNTMNKKYTLGHFILDVVLFSVTGGLWGIWLIFKAMNK